MSITNKIINKNISFSLCLFFPLSDEKSMMTALKKYTSIDKYVFCWHKMPTKMPISNKTVNQTMSIIVEPYELLSLLLKCIKERFNIDWM